MVTTFTELVGIFGHEEVLRTFRSKLRELREVRLSMHAVLQSLQVKAQTCNKNDDFMFEMMIQQTLSDMDSIDKDIKRIQFNIDRLTGQYVGTAFDVDIIKKVPIELFMPSPAKVQTSQRDMYICPLHDEKTPSFIVYKNNNSWYCFGCGSGGDNIALYMKLYESDFIHSCKSLQNLAK